MNKNEESHEKIVNENDEEKYKELKRKINCERQRAYYQRQKDLKKNEEKIKKVPKTNAERQREFRQRNAEKSYMDMKRGKLCSNEENVVQVAMAPKKKKTFKSHSNEVRKKIDFKTSISYHEDEEAYQTSTSYGKTVVTLKPQDIKQKLMIASNVTLECKEIKARIMAGTAQDIKSEPILKRLHSYTNLPTNELKTVFDSVVTRDRSFAKTFKDVRALPEPTICLLANDIRSTFVKYLIEQKVFPSKTDLLKDLKVCSNKYSNETIPIQRLVRNKLIKYQHFPEFNRYLLTEHPERVYQRTMYLSSVKLFRSQHRNFVYVEVRRILPRGTASGFIAGLAALPSIDKLEKFFTKDSPDPIAKKWLQQRILPLIPEGSIVVLAQPKNRNKLTSMGKKSDFLAWLDQNGIPYSKNPHTAELYGLYTKFKTNLGKQGVYDHVFLNAGLALLHMPPECPSLNFFSSIWTDIIVMDGYHPGRPESLKQKIINATTMFSNMSETEETLIQEEFKIIKEDSLMEEIVENVLEMVKKGEVQMPEFPKECCGDKTDYFETYISDIVQDVYE